MEESTVHRSSPTRILICDGEPEYWEEVIPFLVEDGYQVEFTRTAEEAHQALGSASYDLILLARLLPDAPGVEVLRGLQKNFRLSTVPVVMIAHADDVKSMSECMALGARDYLLKPLDWDLLAVAMKSVARPDHPPLIGATEPEACGDTPISLPHGTLEKLEQLKEMCHMLAPRIAALRSSLDVALARDSQDLRVRNIAVAFAELDIALLKVAGLPG